MSNLLVSARPGISVAAYASQAARDAAIEEGARRSVSALRSELTATAQRFRAVQLAIVLLILARSLGTGLDPSTAASRRRFDETRAQK